MTQARDGYPHLFIGWDVGGWNCDKNVNSRDALTVLDCSGTPLGKPWRGNLRDAINAHASAREFLSTLSEYCALVHKVEFLRATIAIDAPLALPEALVQLITGIGSLDNIGDKSAQNPYLYRFTERRVAAEGIVRPLSTIKDMIGSQATKAMHLMSRFNLQRTSPGVWSDNCCLTAIETYPSLCRARLNHAPDRPALAKTAAETDIDDAWVCARIAHAYHFRPETLEFPPPNAPITEGWIWAPLPQSTHR